ncbi:hypothetical protein R80B4_03215 [Fibrobacteres bacterium R8-0-B4]
MAMLTLLAGISAAGPRNMAVVETGGTPNPARREAADNKMIQPVGNSDRFEPKEAVKSRGRFLITIRT